MTGFARSDGALGDATWHWEVRSVNSRSLDLRLRLPPGYEALDPKVREGVTETRHSRQCQCNAHCGPREHAAGCPLE